MQSVIALLLMAAYLVGSFPTGILVARAKGIDLRAVGSGNIGASNVGRALGREWAIFVLVVDAAKGALPVVVGRSIFELTPEVVAAIALAAVLGHMFSVFLKGRGGKGVATSFGAALALAPLPALASFGIYAVLYAAFRISSVGSLAAITAFPIFLWLFRMRAPAFLFFAIAVAVLVFIRHRDNIRRLARGEEHRA